MTRVRVTKNRDSSQVESLTRVTPSLVSPKVYSGGTTCAS